MAMPPIQNPTAQANVQKTKEQQVELPEQASSKAKIALQTKAQLNISILQASEAQLGVKDQPLSLVFKSAIEKINEALTPELGENAIQNAYDAGMDFSPEATADRIVSFATNFFAAYQDNHPDMGQEEALNSFMDLIGGGIQQGFDEARDILGGLQVLEGDVANNVDTTYDLVQQGLEAFRERISSEERETTGEKSTESDNR